jgi:hypothetical protein
LVELGSHVQEVDCRRIAAFTIEADERVDLKVGEVKIDIDTVKPDQKVDESVLLGCRNLGEERFLDFITGRELLVNGDKELESLGVNIANFDTTLMSEEDIVAFTCRVNADVKLSIRRMRKEWLDDEVIQGTSDGLDLACRDQQTIEGDGADEEVKRRH